MEGAVGLLFLFPCGTSNWSPALTCSMGHCLGEITTAPLLWPLLFHLPSKLFQNSKVVFLIDGLATWNPFNVNEPL